MIQELIIGMTTGARDGLIRTAQAVPEDKLNWHPLDKGRTVLDLLGDAAQAPQMVNQLLESGVENFRYGPELFAQMKEERSAWTRDECLEHIRRNTEKMFSLIEPLSDEELGRPVTLPFGGGMTLPLAGWIMMAHRSFTNRFSQINYIQTLYGDSDNH